MIEREPFPPYLQEKLQRHGSLWLGTGITDPHLEVVNGPSLDDIRRAYRDKTPINLTLRSRTFDMDDEEFDEWGEVTVEILEVYDGENDDLHFLAQGEFPYVNESLMWVSEYMSNSSSRADVLVTD